MCVYSTNITTTTTVRGGEGSRRWRLAEGQKNNAEYSIQYVYWHSKRRNTDWIYSTRRWGELALASRGGTQIRQNYSMVCHYSYSTRRWRELGSRGGTNDAIFGTNTTTVRGDKGSWRWRLAKGQAKRKIQYSTVQYSMCTLFVPVLIQWRSRRWRLAERQTSRFSAQYEEESRRWRLRLLALQYQPNLWLASTVCVLYQYLQFLPITTEFLIWSTHMTRM